MSAICADACDEELGGNFPILQSTRESRPPGRLAASGLLTVFRPDPLPRYDDAGSDFRAVRQTRSRVHPRAYAVGDCIITPNKTGPL